MRHASALACLCLATLLSSAVAAPCAPDTCPTVDGYVLNRSQQPAKHWRLRWLGRAATAQEIGQACSDDPICLAFTLDGWLYHRVPFSYLVTNTFMAGNWSWQDVTQCDNELRTSRTPLCGGTYIAGIEGPGAVFNVTGINQALPAGDPGFPCPCIVNTTCGKFSCAAFASNTFQQYYVKGKTPQFNRTTPVDPVRREVKCSLLC